MHSVPKGKLGAECPAGWKAGRFQKKPTTGVNMTKKRRFAFLGCVASTWLSREIGYQPQFPAFFLHYFETFGISWSFWISEPFWISYWTFSLVFFWLVLRSTESRLRVSPICGGSVYSVSIFHRLVVINGF